MATDGNRRAQQKRADGSLPARSRLPWLLATMIVMSLLAVSCRVGTVETQAERATAETSTDGGTGADQAPDSPDMTATAPGTDDPADATGSATDDAHSPAPQATADLPRPLTVSDIDCVAPNADEPTSLTDFGQAMYARHVDTQASIPAYELAVDVNPVTGEVVGAMRAVVPAQERTINFRFFAGMEAFDSGLNVKHVLVNGESVDFVLDRALLSLPASSAAVDSNIVELDFSFTIDQMAAASDLFGSLNGETLQPDQVGLLGRTETGMQLGHWFPVWLPDGIRTDAEPSGFGDIGAFPAANICATITVPPGYQVVTGGTRVDTTDVSIVEAGAGLRDFSMLISNDLVLAARFVSGVEVRVWGPAANPDALMTVLDYAEQSLLALTDAFGPYPWDEIEIVSAPLGSGVGGMEWPGAVWVEQSIFAGGLPGLGDLGELFGDDGFGTMLEAIGGDALTTSLEWTVAHELGHEWWHANVGNDSIESPAVDEPLAQFSACIAMQLIHPDTWRQICEAQTIDQYAQARALGVPDTAAEQASDQFESSLQYGAIIYGKAPGFYFAVADLIGWDALTDSLKTFVDENSFALVSTNTLRLHLVDNAGDDGPAVAELWDRWFREARGDDDIEASDALAGLDGLDGLDLDALFGEDFNLDELLGEDFDIASLFGEDFDIASLFGEDFDIGDLLGENSELFDQALEDLVENSGAGD